MKAETKFRILAADVGIDADAMNATQTSEFIGLADCSEVLVKYKTATRVAFTAIHFEVDWYGTDKGSPIAYESMGISSAQDGTDTVHTLEPDKYTRTTSATVTGECFSIPVKDRFMKLRVSSTAGNVADLISVELTGIKTA